MGHHHPAPGRMGEKGSIAHRLRPLPDLVGNKYSHYHTIHFQAAGAERGQSGGSECAFRVTCWPGAGAVHRQRVRAGWRPNVLMEDGLTPSAWHSQLRTARSCGLDMGKPAKLLSCSQCGPRAPHTWPHMLMYSTEFHSFPGCKTATR